MRNTPERRKEEKGRFRDTKVFFSPKSKVHTKKRKKKRVEENKEEREEGKEKEKE